MSWASVSPNPVSGLLDGSFSGRGGAESPASWRLISSTAASISSSFMPPKSAESIVAPLWGHTGPCLNSNTQNRRLRRDWPGPSADAYLLGSVVVIRRTAAEASLAAHVHLSAKLFFTVGVQENRGGGGHFRPNPPTYSHRLCIYNNKNTQEL